MYFSERVRRILQRAGANIGDRVRIKRGDFEVEGILMPRYSITDRDILVVKLDNGYNVGIKVDDNTIVEVVKTQRQILAERSGAPLVVPLAEVRASPEKPVRVSIIGTGGTIASKIEYETGAVKPAFTSKEILEAVPEIREFAEVSAREVMNVLSENMRIEFWEAIVREVSREIEEGAEGVVVAHGTDTMSYTSSALAFAFRGLPVPIAFVGSQRSSDRPSSDAAFNLIAATLTAARAPFAEVVVIMHGESSDTYALAHRATKVRKMHTSRRDAFQSINALPLAKIYPFDRKIELVSKPLRKRGEQTLTVLNKFEKRVALIKYYPGMDNEIIDFLVDRGYRGLVLEGTGMGHVGEWLIPSIQRAVESGVTVVMTSQTLFGRVNMNVYQTGRKLLAAGVVPGSDMLPEVAFVKLSWVLAHYSDPEEIRSIMLTNLAGEINDRHTLDVYPRWNHG
ncbi:MAG: Glu-tRNA(Gln) amidotransferase subunit GatD [Thermoproteota archaeon]